MRKTAFISTVNSDWSRCAFHRSTQYHWVTSGKLVRMDMEGAGRRPQCGTVHALCWHNRQTLSGWRGRTIGCWGTETRLAEQTDLVRVKGQIHRLLGDGNWACWATDSSGVLHSNKDVCTPWTWQDRSPDVSSFELSVFHSPFCVLCKPSGPTFWNVFVSLPILCPKWDQKSQILNYLLFTPHFIFSPQERPNIPICLKCLRFTPYFMPQVSPDVPNFEMSVFLFTSISSPK